MADTKMQLVDWLDDLCVRFIINLPREELESVERICFQVEEAQWFYEDFIRPLDPTLPSLSLRNFSLRIFQHCPMLSEWSPYHHSAAFSEFLAYKTRVPVRGAIMLNKSMDQVVLVKGWKKGANWSFPRGKINKDEKDLDCAVREVYEETGFDIKAAGLVGDEKDAKFIEVTMREQHMRLYVFRGVPMDTYFEPRTRKEISKIEWYKLSELPTLKKQKHQDGNGHDLAINANKFYMVAPFLVPLKKWISQQKKHDVLSGSYESRLAPTAILEEPVTEDEPDMDNDRLLAQNTFTAQTPSDLPEVSISRVGETQQDPSLHLKRMLNINSNFSPSQDLGHSQEMDPSKSNALLAILRNGRNGSNGADQGGDQKIYPPNTPLEQYTSAPKIPQTPHHHHPQPRPFSQLPPAPAYPFPPASGMTAPSQQFHQSYPWPQQSGFRQPHPEDSMQRAAPFQFPAHVPSVAPSFPPDNWSGPSHQTPFNRQMPGGNGQSQPRGPAPYQRTGDPQFAAPQFPNLHIPSIPPASRLPPAKLTNESLALLNAFKGNGHAIESSNPPGSHVNPSGNRTGTSTFTRNPVFDSSRTAVEVPKLVSHVIDPTQKPQTSPNVRSGPMENYFAHRVSVDSSTKTDTRSEAQVSSEPISTQKKAAKTRPRSQHQENLLNLFRKPSVSGGELSTGASVLDAVPVELSASQPSPLPMQEVGTVRIVKRPSPRLTNINTIGTAKAKDGLTSATVSGPLNQPQFDIMTKSTSRRPSGTSTTAEPTPKKPHSPAAVTILPRRPAGDVGQAAMKTPDNKAGKQPKLFQPQILRRPAQDVEPPNIVPKQEPVVKPQMMAHQPSFDRRGSQPEPHKQTLLSLFGKPSMAGPSPISATNSPPVAASPHSIVSPLQVDTRIGATPPSRSRIGSLSSRAGTVPQTPTSTTSAADKKFLLGFLEGVAKGGK